MFNIDGQIYIRRFHAAKLLQLDHRTLQARASDLGIRTARVPGQVAECYRLADIQKIAAGGKPAPASKATSRARHSKTQVFA